MRPTEKQKRLEHANALIAIIAQHGRCFFRHRIDKRVDETTREPGSLSTDRIARLELRRGRVYFIDHYSQKAVMTHQTRFGNDWKGFTSGGTLRSLVEDMRDYICLGTPIPRWKIVIQQIKATSLEGNIWGYSQDAAQAVRDAAYRLPIIEKEASK